MKKFLFTLAALLMAGSAFADDYLFVDDFEVPQSIMQETSNKKRQMTVPVHARFDHYVSAVQINVTCPEGVTVYNVSTGTDYPLSYYDAMDNLIENFVPGFQWDATNSKGIAAVLLEVGYYYPEGTDPDEDDPVCYGNVKWKGEYDSFLEITLRFAADFAGGTMIIHSEPSSTPDTRGEICPKNLETDIPCNITVEPAEQPEPAPVPTLTWSEDSYTMTAACEGHDVVLMINGEAVENPYTVAQTYEEQEITFVAYTVANADESGNSTEVSQTVTVPAKEKDYAPAPIFREVDGKVYAEAEEGYEVVMMLEGEVCENPYTLPAANYEADQVFHFSAYTVKKNEYGNSATVEYNTTVAKLEKNTPTDPVIFTETTEDRVIVTVAKDPNTDGQLVYDGQPSYARGEQDYEVTVTAYTTEGATYKASGVTTKTFTVPALEQTPVETTTFVKVTSADQLVAGKKYIFVCGDYAMGAEATGNFLLPIAITGGDEVEVGDNVAIMTLGGSASHWTLALGDQYLTAGNSTNLGFGTTATEWVITNNEGALAGFRAKHADYSRAIRKHNSMDRFGNYSTSDVNSEFAWIYVEKSDEPVLQDLAGHIVFGEPTADGKVAVSYNGEEEGVVVTVEGYEVVDGMIQLPEYGTYTLTATATAEGYNALTEEGEVTWNAPVLPTLGGYFVWGVLDENGHFTVTYNNFDYDGPYTLVVKDEDGNVIELDADGEYYQALEGTHTYTAEVTAAGYQPKSENHEYTYVIPTYAPAPKLDWNEANFTMTAYLDTRAYSNEDIELYMNEVKVENPKTVAQTYTEQTLNFKARTIGKDGDENSEWVYMNVTVPAKEMQDSETPVITVTPGEDNYTISATPCTELLIDGVEQTNPYTVARPAVGEEDLVIFVTAINNDGEGYKDATATQRVVIPAKQPVMPVAPSVTTEETEGAVIVTASTTDGSTVVLYQCDANGENAFAVENPMSYTREAQDYTVYVYAVATNNDGSTRSEVKAVVIPAKKQDPETAINEMNAGKTVAAVRYFNMAGQEMQEANGMTIVVTTYTDGTSSAVKVMK